MDYNIEISENDLKLDEHSLFYKIWQTIKKSNENISDDQTLTEEICRAINVARGARLCRLCDGFGWLDSRKCFECKGSGRYD